MNQKEDLTPTNKELFDVVAKQSKLIENQSSQILKLAELLLELTAKYVTLKARINMLDPNVPKNPPEDNE